MKNKNLLKSCVSEICIKQINVNQGVGVGHVTVMLAQPLDILNFDWSIIYHMTNQASIHARDITRCFRHLTFVSDKYLRSCQFKMLLFDLVGIFKTGLIFKPRKAPSKLISTHKDLEHKQEVAGDTTNYHHLITTWLK